MVVLTTSKPVRLDSGSVVRTDVGLLPVDWDTPRLGDIVHTTQLGGNYRNSSRETPWPLIKMGNMERGSITLLKVEFITSDSTPHSHDRLCRGDILFNTRNTLDLVGKVCIWNDELQEAYFNSNIMRLSFRAERVASQRFMNYVLNSEQVISALRGIATGTTSVAAIYYRDLSKILVPLPPRTEQRAIAEALTDTDALIEGLESLIAKKRAIKQGAMQALLSGRRRLAGFESEEALIKDQFGEYPASWRTMRLADLVDSNRPIRYGIVQPGRYDPRGRFMIRGQDYSLAKGWADPSDVFRVSEGVEAKYRNARVRAGDLIITIVGYCGHVEMVPAWLDGANLTQTTARLAIQPAIANAAYCKYLIRSTYVQRQVSAYLKGNAQPGLNCGDVEKFLLPMPSIEEQVQIADFLTDLDDEVAALGGRLAKARQIKQGMMQELLTGRVRLA